MAINVTNCITAHIFIAPFTAQSTEYATITNNSEQSIAFKVKTTAPKFYCVRPNAAIVAPGESVQVQVILLGLTKEPAADFKCRDKFLVITLPAPYDLGNKPVADAWSELETEFKQQAVSKKIKVKYLLNSESGEHQQEEPHQIQQEKELDDVSSPGDVVPTTAGSQVTDSVNQQVEEPEVSHRKEEIPKTSVSEKIPTTSTTTTTTTEPVSAQEGSLNSTALILIAIIALVLGWLYY